MYYNTVLLPPDSIAGQAFAFAGRYLQPQADGYCLEAGKVLPHVTLCQIYCEDVRQVSAYRQSLDDLPPLPQTVCMNDVYCMPGIGQHAGYIWTGLSVARNNPPLQRLHEAISGRAREQGLAPLNKALADYWPHLTFARLKGGAVPAFDVTGYADFFAPDGIAGWRLAFGESDINGRFLRCL